MLLPIYNINALDYVDNPLSYPPQFITELVSSVTSNAMCLGDNFAGN